MRKTITSLALVSGLALGLTPVAAFADTPGNCPLSGQTTGACTPTPVVDAYKEALAYSNATVAEQSATIAAQRAKIAEQARVIRQQRALIRRLRAELARHH